MQPDETDAFIAGLQHDLRSELNLVLNYTDLLLEDLRDPDVELTRAIDEVSGAGQRAQAALEDLLEERTLDPETSLAALRRALDVFVRHLDQLEAAAAAVSRPDAPLDVLRIEAAVRRALALASHRRVGR
ncbi:MAG: histidine kinase dimerization/phospho-acceptor domain-containing protein, partial [Acidimicrobiales bacterium]